MLCWLISSFFFFSISDGSSKLLTAEQAQVVNYKMQPGEVVKVMAFAGNVAFTITCTFTHSYTMYVLGSNTAVLF